MLQQNTFSKQDYEVLLSKLTQELNHSPNNPIILSHTKILNSLIGSLITKTQTIVNPVPNLENTMIFNRKIHLSFWGKLLIFFGIKQ